MKKGIITIILWCLFGFGTFQVKAQTPSTSTNLVAQPIPDRTVSYSVTATGVAKPLLWGLDTAWPSEANMRRGIAFMGADRVDLVRASFQPTLPLVNGDLQQPQITDLNYRLSLISLTGPNTQVTLNSDHPSVDPWYSGNAARWAQLMDVTTRRVQEAGRTVVSIAPFNEPDNGSTGQGSMQDFYNIAGELKLNPRFNTIRISGGNTLNNDQALPWYTFLKDRLDEGNTHQLAGGFDSFASFYQTVRANGDHATGDELHNVMEAMVGVEYGMQTGIWWGTAEWARGEFVKASDGMRLGYAEHRPNWTAASVYRGTDGKVQAFAGGSERQATTTTYRYVSKDKAVYYDGQGPQREYTLVLPGGTGYWQNQPNAERVITITWGEDIQPVINGRYALANRNSGKVMEVAGGSPNAGANLQQGTNTGATYQQWNVTPVDSRVGGDFSYFTFTAVHSGKSPDLLNWSLENGASIIVWDDLKSGNQQWYLDYVGDGWFYIRSRQSAKCLQVAADGVSIVQQDINGATNQQWRFLPVGAPVEFNAPGAPSNLVATANAESVRLNWTASSATDVAGYTIFRAESASGPYNTIARNVTATSFVDNTATTSGTYFYKIKAVDLSLNRSVYSNQVSASPTGTKDLVAHLPFDGNTLDNSINLNHSASYGSVSFGAGKVGSGGIALNGTNAFVQLPSDLANQSEITLATWVYWNGGAAWQRIFDFGNDQSQNMFLSPSSGSGQLRFAIKNGGAEQGLDAPALPTGQWSHVAVTLGTSGATMYVNGQLVAQSNTVTIRPLDFKPVLNYIGRSQYPDPLLNGRIDDFKVYNYAMSAIEIANLGSAVTYYQVRNRATGLNLDGMGRTTSSHPNGATCGQYANTVHINSHWDLIEAGSGYYRLQNRGTGLLLDGMGRTTNGANADQSPNTTSQSSNWTLEPYNGNYYRIQNRSTGLYLDGLGYTTNGADVGQWANATSSNAQWEFISTSSSRMDSQAQADLLVPKTVLYPNPTSKVLHIQLSNKEEAAQARIFNFFGQFIKSTHLKGPDTKVEVGELPSGIYIVEVTTASETTRLRFVKD